MNKRKREIVKISEHGVITEEAMFAYLNDELSTEQKREFEKLLDEDPFAQDALEGLRHAEDRTALVGTIASVKQKVRERSGVEKKVLKIHWTAYAMAAVVLGLLIGIGFVMVNYIGNGNKEMAENKKADTDLLERKIEEPQLKPAAATADTTAQAQNPVAEEQTTTTNATTTQAEKTNQTPETQAPATKNTVAPVNESKPVLASENMKQTQGAGAAEGLAAEKKTTNAEANAPAENKYAAAMKKEEVSKGKKDESPPATTQGLTEVRRGAIVEKVESDKVTVVSLDEATKAYERGDYKKSAELYDAYLSKQPDNADALFFGGISDYVNGNYKKSEKNFDKLIKDGTKFVEGSKWYKANILIQKGKKDEAKALLKELSDSGGTYYKEKARKKLVEIL